MRNFNRFDNKEKRFSSRDRNSRPMMYQAVCDDCGDNCEVPFKPSGNKPVYCSKCFEKQGGFERSDSFDRDSRDREMFSAVCDECGKTCKLPFKPTSSKPVYCSDCFEMRGERSGANNFREDKSSDNSREIRELKDQIFSLNTKLDRIISALNIKPEENKKPKTIKVSKKKMAEVENASL